MYCSICGGDGIVIHDGRALPCPCTKPHAQLTSETMEERHVRDRRLQHTPTLYWLNQDLVLDVVAFCDVFAQLSADHPVRELLRRFLEKSNACETCGRTDNSVVVTDGSNFFVSCGNCISVEINNLEETLKERNAEIERLTKERDGYKRAKEENDERYLTERDEARAQLAEREAACAAMRAVLVRVNDGAGEDFERDPDIDAALSSSAGTGLLAELERLRRIERVVLEEVERIRTTRASRSHGTASDCSACALDHLERALAAALTPAPAAGKEPDHG